MSGSGGPNVTFRCSLKNTIYDVLKSKGWTETDSDTEWDFNWADKGWIHEHMDKMHLEEHQRVNHFRNHYELTRKDLLVKNLKRAKKALEREGQLEEAASYDFFPATFVLPGEYSMFVEEFKKMPGTVWIMKPIGKSQGKGIFLITKLSQISDWRKDYRWNRVTANDDDSKEQMQGQQERPQAEAYIVQKYIPNPYLIGGKKFDLRIYALVTSFSPLTVYLYRTGFARFSNTRFSLDPKDLSVTYVHLTNVAIQKYSPAYTKDKGCKWWLHSLKMYMISKHGVEATNKLFHDIQRVILRALLAVQKVIINDKHCFEMYGYDVLIDDNLKPILLEVNASPSLTAETTADFSMKFALLEDLLTVIDMEHRFPNNSTEEQVGGFDLIYKGGPTKPSKPSVWTSYLGCSFDRVKNMKKLLANSRGLTPPLPTNPQAAAAPVSTSNPKR
mmetsp:Transcript_32475/g.52602  ORF Transcript_32475/g.52602 Transcript_32475/m.52602 type:complete len:444 (+) Transcript_32475:184-1515(+)|eukprot:CAMPEP_0184657442 /NCGR_PEP_ID=MMETSP0308-20130426/19618_1 /TAXON_ID=38269 /ORGANISM="Gloeochaete witrockiana, Strain SAG 46.84" /LENGTH=443 /DNA_ID=CAMNT_0027095277 /DNA_START=107 /DNA_END=1438 /DNA_ORIENTATION=-